VPMCSRTQLAAACSSLGSIKPQPQGALILSQMEGPSYGFVSWL
jgi:hypothetical protein